MKIIYLNALVAVPNEEGEEKIQRASSRQVKDNKTPPKSWFLEQNLTPPSDAEDDVEVDDDGNVLLDDEEVDFLPLPLSIPLDNIGSWASNLDGGSTVFTKSNLMYNVLEEVWEIDSMIEYMTMSWFDKKYLLFKSFCAKIIGKKVVSLQELLSEPENQPEYKQ